MQIECGDKYQHRRSNIGPCQNDQRRLSGNRPLAIMPERIKATTDVLWVAAPRITPTKPPITGRWVNRASNFRNRCPLNCRRLSEIPDTPVKKKLRPARYSAVSSNTSGRSPRL